MRDLLFEYLYWFFGVPLFVGFSLMIAWPIYWVLEKLSGKRF